jgi:hypothetical protein
VERTSELDLFSVCRTGQHSSHSGMFRMATQPLSILGSAISRCGSCRAPRGGLQSLPPGPLQLGVIQSGLEQGREGRKQCRNATSLFSAQLL